VFVFPRRTIVTSRGRRYEYIHLVESVRREGDRRPVHQVIGNLGPYDEVKFHNIKVALEASRARKRVAVVTTSNEHAPAKPSANLRYLDIAVACELWRQWGLADVLRDLMPVGEGEVPGALIVETLVAQRLVAPASKLAAVRWFPRTALPELLGIAPSQFNNTRLHRVLDDLEANTPSLMAKLPRLYQQRNGVFASLFLDVTDTWFVGHGPDLTVRAKTKEGLIARKIGIVLLCNERGYPIRWEVIKGNCSDGVAMTEMMQAISNLDWVGDTPVVVDRAMGRSAYVRAMVDAKLRFLTALTRTEFSTYATELPWAATEGLFIENAAHSKVAAEAARRAEAAGMQKVDDKLFVLDFGVVQPSAIDDEEVPDGPQDEEPNARAMRLCRQARQAVIDGRYSSHAAAGRALGLDRGVLSKYRQLLKLPEDIQRAILEGSAAGQSLASLLHIARLDAPQAQRAAFEALVKSTPPMRASVRPPAPHPAADAPDEPAQPLRVRVVAYFNPERFVEKRRAATHHLQRVEEFVAALNKKLANPRSRRSRSKILADIDRRLRRDDMLEVFDVDVEEKDVDGRRRYHVELALKAEDWRRRRRYDGFTVLVGHQNLPQTAPELARLYRAKDMVEKDFQVVKGVTELRPVRHRTDLKVRAHVTLCMLALLLERALRDKLSGSKYTVEQALELLEPCRLNRYRSGSGPGLYTITEIDKQQRSLLRKLRLLHLADDDHLAAHISPR
jgi:hypothetical protein